LPMPVNTNFPPLTVENVNIHSEVGANKVGNRRHSRPAVSRPHVTVGQDSFVGG